jgi:metal-sulfur cluster biosynthetic enzyme
MITNNEAYAKIALDALRNVVDPEIGLNIVDLGLIYQIDFDEPGLNVFVSMTLTSRFCPMGESIIDNTRENLKNSFPGYKIIIDLVYDPVWNADKISEEGKRFLDQ